VQQIAIFAFPYFVAFAKLFGSTKYYPSARFKPGNFITKKTPLQRRAHTAANTRISDSGCR
jgi:hypothetical protein